MKKPQGNLSGESETGKHRYITLELSSLSLNLSTVELSARGRKGKVKIIAR